MGVLLQIYKYLSAFLEGFGGLIGITVMACFIAKIIIDAKKPRINERMKQKPPPQEGGFIPKGTPYQGNYRQGPMYPNFLPRYNMPEFDPEIQRRKQKQEKIVVIIALLIPTLFIVFMFISLVSCINSFKGCNWQSEMYKKEYRAALDALALKTDYADAPETVSLYGENYEILFSSEYNIVDAAGDVLILENPAVKNTYLGKTRGYYCLASADGRLLTPKDKYYLYITETSLYKYNGENVIVCTDHRTDGFYTPNIQLYSSQKYFSLKGEEIDHTSLSYDPDDFGGETEYTENNKYIRADDGQLYIKDYAGSIEYHHNDGDTDRKLEEKAIAANKRASYIIVDKDRNIVFPKNAVISSVDNNTLSEDKSHWFSGEYYNGDTYKYIYAYEPNAGYVAGVRYYPLTDSCAYGVYTLDGEPLFESDAVIDLGDKDTDLELSDKMQINDNCIMMPSKNGFYLFGFETGDIKAINNTPALVSGGRYFYSDDNTTTFCSLYDENKQSLSGICSLSGDVLCIKKGGISSFYKLSATDHKSNLTNNTEHTKPEISAATAGITVRPVHLSLIAEK